MEKNIQGQAYSKNNECDRTIKVFAQVHSQVKKNSQTAVPGEIPSRIDIVFDFSAALLL